jgi:hypothetical protein
MDPIVSYLVETETRVKAELAELFQRIQVEQTATAYKSIVDLYDVPEIPVGDKHPKITYSPCVQIEFPTGGYDTKLYPNSAYRNCNCGRMKFTSEFKLPDHEKIVRVYLQVEDDQNNRRQTGTATFITDYGRVIKTLDAKRWDDQYVGTGYVYYTPSQNGVEVNQCNTANQSVLQPKKIVQLEPLPYKLPKWCIDTVLAVETLNESELQRISKDVFVFVGRWKDHITQHVTLDTEQLLSIKNEQAQRISVLEEAKKDLEAEDRFNKTLVKKLQERVTMLEQQTTQLPTLKTCVKEVIIFMNKQNGTTNCDYVNGSFSGFMHGKVCIPERDLLYYQSAMEELNEFKIAERVRNRGIRDLQGEVRAGIRGIHNRLGNQ